MFKTEDELYAIALAASKAARDEARQKGLMDAFGRVRDWESISPDVAAAHDAAWADFFEAQNFRDRGVRRVE